MASMVSPIGMTTNAGPGSASMAHPGQRDDQPGGDERDAVEAPASR
jgi:hypothetical protein